MKKSEEYFDKASKEDNDFKSFALHKKGIREARLEKFEVKYWSKLDDKFTITPFDGTKYTIDTQTKEYGIVDYFPKANRILIRKDNKWVDFGLDWIDKNLLNK